MMAGSPAGMRGKEGSPAENGRADGNRSSYLLQQCWEHHMDMDKALTDIFWKLKVDL